eukprot:TRINITY_DN432_c0_g2_i2.p1 TRINITY_DN432_c0_g2~~TRINITY_DN432_c0_g2_i2.p1  ORF type:complete len:516 (-),score=95.88 TRINITY_DN432_c0_g2_i2:369-1916(-)
MQRLLLICFLYLTVFGAPGDIIVKLSDSVSADEYASHLGLTNKGELGPLPNTYLFGVPSSSKRNLLEFLSIMQSDKRVVYAEEDIIPGYKKKQSGDPGLTYQWHHQAIGSQSAWDMGITGQGIVAQVIDDGIFATYDEVSGRVDIANSLNPQTGSTDPSPSVSYCLSQDDDCSHGTFCAGLLGATANNSYCGRGVAYDVTFTGFAFLGTPATVSQFATAYMKPEHISSNSYATDGCVQDQSTGDISCDISVTSNTELDALRHAVQTGRNGKGKIFCFAASNEGDVGDSPNYREAWNYYELIVIGALNPDGTTAFYSSYGPAVFISAPGGQPVLNETAIYGGTYSANSGRYCDYFGGGTSYATPILCGVTALLLQASPELTWRDVRHILQQSAVKTDPNHPDWVTNAAGIPFNVHYGFGRVDVTNAIAIAASFPANVPLISHSYQNTDTKSLSAASTVTSSISIPVSDNCKVESIQLFLDITIARRGALNIYVTSPGGMFFFPILIKKGKEVKTFF